jgi:uncharacterized C2H2 Zn-finger protein
MVSYKCDRCGKLYNHKSEYIRHTNRKNPCKSTKEADNKSNITTADQPHIAADQPQTAANNINISNKKCPYCSKLFTRPYNLTVHLNGRCKVKKQQDNEKENLLQKLIAEMSEMKRIISKLESENKKYIQNNSTKIGSQQNTKIDSQQNIQINNMNNIKLLAFGKEDMSYLVDEVYKKILNKGFKSVPTFVQYLHFNKDKPQNHNVYISNIQTNYALVYDGEDWKLKERDDVLQQLIDDKTAILSDKFDELLTKLDEPTVRKFRRFLNESDDDDVISQIKSDLKLLLYNNKKIPERTRQLFCPLDEVNKMIEN